MLSVFVFALLGCHGWNNNQEGVSEESIRLAIEPEISDIQNLDIKFIENFRGNPLVMYSFDLGDGHYIACRHVDKHNRLSGGSGPAKADTSQPLSVVSFGSDTENYFITYGEVYDSSINTIEIIYDNGENKRVEPRDAAFLFVANQDVNGPVTLNAYDSTGQVVFSLP